MPRFAVIIPAYNEELIIEDCLRSLVNQTSKEFKAYIVDDASTDATRQKILGFQTKYPDLIELCEFGKVGPGRARNLMAQKVDSEFLAFMDADCIATPHWLEELIKGFDRAETASTGGPHLAPPQSNDFQLKIERFFKLSSRIIDFYKTSSSLEICSTSHNPLCNVAYRRDVFLQLNGFREDLFPGEDIEFDLRLNCSGYRITYNPKALVFHHRPETLEAFRKVMFAYGRAQGKLVRERGPHRLLHWVGLFVLAIPLSWIFIYGPRPKSESTWGIIMGSLDWFRGYVHGFWTNRSMFVLPTKKPVDQN